MEKQRVTCEVRTAFQVLVKLTAGIKMELNEYLREKQLSPS
jgi:hypothetical protein